MTNPFISANTFISPSLNRVQVISLPDEHFPDQWRGLDGYMLLSAASLETMINEQASVLSLISPDPNPLQTFNRCFEAPSTAVRSAASDIATAYGRRLALLLLTLKQGQKANQQARSSWSAEHWEFWTGIKTFCIGGGLLAGLMGPPAVSSANEALRLSTGEQLHVYLSPLGAYLPLAGLGRMAPESAQGMLVLDFGQSRIKRAVVRYQTGSGNELHPLTDHPAALGSDPQPAAAVEHAAMVARRIITVVAQSWQEVLNRGCPLCPVIGLSLACYLVNGQPPPYEMGYYGRLQLLSDNVETYLAAHISAAIGQSVQIHLVHDGTAAGITLAGKSHAVALMLGTAIGVGFPPPLAEGLQDTPWLCTV